MKPFMLAGIAAVASLANAQSPLTCQSGAGIDPANCPVVHYHVRMYRPDTKTSVELTGVNRFASRSACESALAAERARNAEVIDFLKKNEPRLQYQADQFGACHCDMTATPASANYLDDAKRVAEWRMQLDILTRVRLRLLDSDALPNSELVRSLRVPPSTFDEALWPRMVISPASNELVSVPEPILEADTKATAVGTDLSKAMPSQSLDFPLADVPTPKDVMVTRAVAPSVIADGSAGADTTDAAPAPETPAETNAAEAFVNYETARVQAILRASGQVDDASLKKSIFEAAMARLQLLSNLKLVVETAGSRSRLAESFAAADSEPARLELVGKLFGETVQSHWAPADAKDVVIQIPADLTGDPFAVLREGTGKYSSEQRRQALYHLLGRASNLTSSQLLSLTDMMQSFL